MPATIEISFLNNAKKKTPSFSPAFAILFRRHVHKVFENVLKIILVVITNAKGNFFIKIYKSAPLDAITFLYQKKESLREREKSPVPSSWRLT